MRRTKEEAEITRQNLLKAALIVFSRQGYATTRLEDIAEEAGVTRGAIYHHFGSKFELYNTLVAESSARFSPRIMQAFEGGGNSLDILHRLFVGTLHYVADDDDFRAVQELVLFKTGIVPELEQGVQQKIEGTRGLVNLLAQTVRQGIDDGVIRTDVDPRDAALTFMGLQNGLLTLWLLDRHLFHLKERAEALADLFIQSVAKQD